MPKLLLIFLGIIIFISCNRKEKSINPVLPTNTAKVASIIDDIAKDGDVDAAMTGIAGIKSDQYKRYEWMKQSASDELLVRLTDHISPAVRVYAFFVLAQRNSTLLSEIAKKHKDDSARFISQSGCVGMQDQVNNCFHRIVNGRNWFVSIEDIDYNPSKK